MAGGTKDEFELYNRKPEFGQGEIGDKDRYPHLYWNVHKGRNTIQRVAHQWGFSKDIKPEKVRRDLEKHAYFLKLDSLNFLEQHRHHYSFLDDDSKGSIGYISEDEDDEILEHVEYGQAYNNSSLDYRHMVLEDQCNGRPTYEWQIPSRLDHACGYTDVSTAVDILGRESSLQNLEMKWKLKTSSDSQGITLQNLDTMSEICLTPYTYASSIIQKWQPNTVVLQCSADKLLTSMKHKFSSSSRTNLMGCCISVSWCLLFFMGGYFPEQPIIALSLGSLMVAMNSVFIYRTFFDKKSLEMYNILKLCRKYESDIVLGDWLLEDYDERLNQISTFDKIGGKETSALPLFNIGSDDESSLVSNGRDEEVEQSGLKTKVKTLMDIISRYQPSAQMDTLKVDIIGDEDWMNSFRDAVNNRRIDLISHVLHNCHGQKILMCTDAIDNISANLVVEMLVKRLNGEIEIKKSPLLFDGYYERVQVQF